MNPILLSFLCGAAFIGGATVVVIMVAVAASLKDTKAREELLSYWRCSNKNEALQICVLHRIAEAIEALNKDKPNE